jgi:hypothetical protein
LDNTCLLWIINIFNDYEHSRERALLQGLLITFRLNQVLSLFTALCFDENTLHILLQLSCYVKGGAPNCLQSKLGLESAPARDFPSSKVSML